MNGTVDSTTTDWRGDTLIAAVSSGDTVLAVGDTTDFDEDDSTTRWLTIADTTPREYVAVNEDAGTITLVATAGAAFEAGDPVVVWDPSVLPSGAKVVEYLATVTTDRGPVDAVVPHEKIPLAGIDSLVGASVTLAEDDSDLYIDQIRGRVPVLDQSVIDVSFITLYQAANVLRSSGTTYATMNDWTMLKQSGIDYDPTTGKVTFLYEGHYAIGVAVTWAGASSGARKIQLVSTVGGVDTTVRETPGAPPDATQYAQQITKLDYEPVVGEEMRVQSQQNSGASLDLRGDAAGRLTVFEIVRLHA